MGNTLDVAAPAHPPTGDTTTRYRPRDPTHTALYQLVVEQHATFAEVAQDAGGLSFSERLPRSRVR
jgi:hypothetical protein